MASEGRPNRKNYYSNDMKKVPVSKPLCSMTGRIGASILQQDKLQCAQFRLNRGGFNCTLVGQVDE